MLRVPQIEGLFVPSPEIDPHKNALVKLLLFKPLHVSQDLDEQSNPADPFTALHKSALCTGKRIKGDPDKHYR